MKETSAFRHPVGPSVPGPLLWPNLYISFQQALNLRAENEVTGDWHQALYFGRTDRDADITWMLAGRHGLIDTSSYLESFGIRDLGSLLHDMGLNPEGHEIHVAGHARAIADLVALEMSQRGQPESISCDQVNAWLDTKAQIDVLREEYLVRLQPIAADKNLYKAWLGTILYN